MALTKMVAPSKKSAVDIFSGLSVELKADTLYCKEPQHMRAMNLGQRWGCMVKLHLGRFRFQVGFIFHESITSAISYNRSNSGYASHHGNVDPTHWTCGYVTQKKTLLYIVLL